MDILPIESIREEDGLLVGKNLLNLAKLYQAKIGYAEGIIILPPEIKIKTLLEHYQFKEREVFEQSLHIFKKDILNIESPEELSGWALKNKLNPKKIWQELLENWLGEIRSRIWREGFSKDLLKSLMAQPIFITKKIKASGQAFVNPVEKKLSINLHYGKFSIEQEVELEELVTKANKKLFFPQVYSFIFDSKIRFVKITPFTPSEEKLPINPVSKKEDLEDLMQKISTKIFLDFSEGFKIIRNIDGVIINSEKENTFEVKLAKLAEIAFEYPQKIVIFKLADIKTSGSNIRGALRLIHDQKLLKKEAEVFLFSRNKKHLYNTQLAIPIARSVDEFLEIKKDLAVLGISRKGSLKLWLEVGIPENIINIEKYLVAGLDGIIINLDELANLIAGVNFKDAEAIFYKQQLKSVEIFLEDGMKILSKAKVPVIFSGNLTWDEKFLEFIIEKGVFGLVADLNNLVNIHDQLVFMEKHYLKHKLLN